MREIVLRYKGVGRGERKGRYVDMSGILGYGSVKFLDKLDGIADEESKRAILIIASLRAAFCKVMYAHFDLLL